MIDWIIDRMDQVEQNEGWVWLVYMVPMTLFLVLGISYFSAVFCAVLAYLIYTVLRILEWKGAR